MACSKCKYEFCWICMGSYTRYMHTPGQEAICPIILMIKVVFCLILASLILLVLLRTFWYVPELPKWSSVKEFLMDALYHGGALILSFVWFSKF